MSIQSSRVFVIYYIQNKLQAEFIESPRKAAVGDGEQEEEVDVEEVAPVKEKEDEDEGVEEEVMNEVKEVRNMYILSGFGGCDSG